MTANRQLHRVLMLFLFWAIGTTLGFGEAGNRQTSQGSDVEVVAKALDVSDATAEFQRFEVEFTTHAVNLDFDLAAIALLGDEKGTLVPADSWTGGRGGHHLSGVLSFRAQDLLGFQSLELTLDPPGLGKRTFSWTPKQESVN